ncbi:MAG TPA: P-loop NTPase, partial [Thermomicrobiales bacterium]|nr:P-loop NTPase [Thermomicrobiales bacterium]
HLAIAFPTAAIQVSDDVRTYRGGTGFGEDRHVVAVLGGKGGVGKSTTAINLALTLSAMGISVGLLDADLSAPDIPHMVGIHPERSRQTPSEGEQPGSERTAGPPSGPRSRMAAWELWRTSMTPRSGWRQPLQRYGIEVMSIGLAIPEDAPPLMTSRLMVSALLREFVFQVAWSADVLLIDAPPGTGDELQVMAHELPLSGAIFVTTPQDLAQMDAERTLSLLTEHGVPVIGAVQNMASLHCPHCAGEIDLFARSSRLADAGVPILGRIPFDLRLSEAVDAGRPLVLADPRGPVSYEFAKVGHAVRQWLRE